MKKSCAFDNVSTAGNTSLDLSDAGPPVPGSFIAGDPPTYYNITSDADHSGNIEICVTYDENALVVPELLVRILHWDTTQTPDAWVDITTSLNTVDNIVCGITTRLSPFLLGTGSATGIGDTPGAPLVAALHQNYPNPFNPTTTIQYDVPSGGARVDLAVYDVAGRLVTRLVARDETAGYKSVVWDGRNHAGRPVATGVYFYRLRAGEFVETRKMVLLK